jgi:peptidoglycan hydrolase-like protein with peptidoglycan-binding domain
MGPKTRDALRKYQQEQGLEATGELDTETARRLNVAH